jgi:hypothetical protein
MINSMSQTYGTTSLTALAEDENKNLIASIKH